MVRQRKQKQANKRQSTKQTKGIVSKEDGEKPDWKGGRRGHRVPQRSTHVSPRRSSRRTHAYAHSHRHKTHCGAVLCTLARQALQQWPASPLAHTHTQAGTARGEKEATRLQPERPRSRVKQKRTERKQIQKKSAPAPAALPLRRRRSGAIENAWSSKTPPLFKIVREA